MRPVLLGMNNPDRAGDPFPPGDGGTGSRLCDVSGMPVADYDAAFERMNLVEARRWSMRAARYAAPAVRRRLRGRRVVVLGREVWKAIGLPPTRWFTTIDRYGASWSLIPHASGLNLYYNAPENRAAARAFLRGMLCDRGLWRK